MWSRKGTPEEQSHFPVPSIFIFTKTDVSFVFLSTKATRPSSSLSAGSSPLLLRWFWLGATRAKQSLTRLPFCSSRSRQLEPKARACVLLRLLLCLLLSPLVPPVPAPATLQYTTAPGASTFPSNPLCLWRPNILLAFLLLPPLLLLQLFLRNTLSPVLFGGLFSFLFFCSRARWQITGGGAYHEHTVMEEERTNKHLHEMVRIKLNILPIELQCFLFL